MLRPTSVEPVKVMPLTRGCVPRASPTSPPRPMTRLTTPAGIPASWSISTMITEVSGDSDDDAYRLAHCVGQKVTPPAWQRLSPYAQGLAGGKPHLAYAALHLGARLADGLAHLQRHRLRQFLAAAPPDLYQAMNVLHPLGRWDVPPLLEGPMGGLDGSVYVFRGRERIAPHDLAGSGWVARLVRFAAARGDPLAVNVVLVGFHCSLRLLHCVPPSYACLPSPPAPTLQVTVAVRVSLVGSFMKSCPPPDSVARSWRSQKSSLRAGYKLLKILYVLS